MLATGHYARGEGFHDFFTRMARRLGGSVGVNYCCRDRRGGVQEVQTVFLSCPREAWVENFGEPQHVRKHFDIRSGKWLRAWEQQLPDGPVCCVGQFFERSPGANWIIVRRLSVPRNEAACNPTNRGGGAGN
jgi:hypothetical protein